MHNTKNNKQQNIFKKWQRINEINVVAIVLKLLMPFIFMFGFYIQFHGKTSPGGGFQSGIIFAIGYILQDAVCLLSGNYKKKHNKLGLITASLGVMIYASTGTMCIVLGGSLFDYSVFTTSHVLGRQMGLLAIETGVASTVFGSMVMIYNSFRDKFIESEQICEMINHK